MRLSFPSVRSNGLVQNLAIAVVSAALGILLAWRAPGLDRYAADWLMRMRGPLPTPSDIAIVAIDEPSIGRLGRFPWPRQTLAQAVQRISAGRPKSIAIDVLFADPTTPDQDQALASTIRAAGNMTIAAQMVETNSGGSEWLMPIASIAEAAAATGHVNVLAESEGVGRELLARMADSNGRSLFALAIEAVRLGDRVSSRSVIDNGRALIVGRRVIPLESGDPVAMLKHTAGAPPESMRAGRMAIDYIGPTNSFAPATYSIADVIDGRVPPSTFEDRYVLIGATAASIGERFASPFVHASDASGNQHGTLMPGVEVLANAVNTILRERFYSRPGDAATLLVALLIALVTLAALRTAQGRFALLKQLTVLAAVALLFILGSVLAFAKVLWIAPVVPGLVSFASAGVLGLLRRSLLISSRLDRNIADVARASSQFVGDAGPDEAAAAISRLANASAVSIYSCEGGRPKQLVARYGPPLPADGGRSTDVESLASGAGLLVVASDPSRPPAQETWRACTAIAEDCLARQGDKPRTNPSPAIPKGLEDKAEMLGSLNSRILRQTQFVSQSLRSVEDGLLIASADATIRFANPAAGEALGSTPEGLIGRNLLERIADCTTGLIRDPAEALCRLLVDRSPIETEIATRGARPRYFLLRLAPVPSSSGVVTGIVASLADITRQKELHQTQREVMSLVSHEMRTPLSAIQGMSELLTTYELPPERRRELNIAINDEAKRLTRMITQYLDLARLESGVLTPRLAPVRLEAVVDRTLMMLEPLANARGIAVTRTSTAGLPPVLADAELFARAAENLISNAIKYSPAGTSVLVALHQTDPARVQFEVKDQGYGIPEPDVDRVFEKFYRVPRPQDADVPGTGLGLALVKEIAELHGGSVTVVSKVNVGSTFTITLPVNPGEEKSRVVN